MNSLAPRVVVGLSALVLLTAWAQDPAPPQQPPPKPPIDSKKKPLLLREKDFRSLQELIDYWLKHSDEKPDCGPFGFGYAVWVVHPFTMTIPVDLPAETSEDMTNPCQTVHADCQHGADCGEDLNHTFLHEITYEKLKSNVESNSTFYSSTVEDHVSSKLSLEVSQEVEAEASIGLAKGSTKVGFKAGIEVEVGGSKSKTESTTMEKAVTSATTLTQKIGGPTVMAIKPCRKVTLTYIPQLVMEVTGEYSAFMIVDLSYDKETKTWSPWRVGFSSERYKVKEIKYKLHVSKTPKVELSCDCNLNMVIEPNPTGDPKNKFCGVFDSGQASVLLRHADDFGIGTTLVTTHPNAKTVTITIVAPPGDEFGVGNASTDVIALKRDASKPLPENAVKTQTKSDGSSEITVDLEEISKNGVTGILAGVFPAPGKSAKGKVVPIQHVQFAISPAGADLPAAQQEITALSAPEGTGAPILMTNRTGQTPLVAIHGIIGDEPIAIGEKTESGIVPFGNFIPQTKFTQRNETGVVAETTTGIIQGDPKKMAAMDPKVTFIGKLTEDRKFLQPDSKPINDVVRGGIPTSHYGKATPKIHATPEKVVVGQTALAEAEGEEQKRIHARANRFPEKFVMENLGVVLFYEGKEVDFKPDRATDRRTAERENDQMKWSATFRWINPGALAAALDKNEAAVLESTGSAREAFTNTFKQALTANLSARTEAAKKYFSDR